MLWPNIIYGKNKSTLSSLDSKFPISNLVEIVKMAQEIDLLPVTRNSIIGVQISETINCSEIDSNGSGTQTLNIDENDTTFAWNGTITFNECTTFGATSNGTIKFAETCTYNPDDVSAGDSCAGKVITSRFTMSDSIDTIVIANATTLYYDNYLAPYHYTESNTLPLSTRQRNL